MLFGKIKCPACGQKNDKSRMTCAACGAPLFLDKEDRPPASVPPVAREAPPTAEVAAAAAAPPQPETAPPGDKTVLFSCRVTNGDAEVTLTGETLAFKEGKKPTEIPLPAITGFEYHLNLTAITSSVAKPVIGHVSVDYTNEEGKNKDIGFHLTRDKIELLKHYLYKQIVGRHIDTDPAKIKDVYEINVALLNGLRNAGLDAWLAAPKQLEEKIEAEFTLGMIAIEPGPIRWVNIRTDNYESIKYAPVVTSSRNPLLETVERIATRDYYYRFIPELYYTDYGVPDIKMRPDQPEMVIYLEETDGRLRWTGIEPARRFVNALNARPGLLHPALNKYNIRITPYAQYSCWIISVQGAIMPDPELWSCYHDIAEILLSLTK